MTLLLVLYRTTFRYENVSRPLAISVWSIITWAILLRWTIRASTVGRAWSRDSTRGLNGSDSKCRARDFGDKGRLSLWEAWNYKMSSSMFLVRRNTMKVRQVFYNQVHGLLVVTKQKSGYNACTILHFGKMQSIVVERVFCYLFYHFIKSKTLKKTSSVYLWRHTRFFYTKKDNSYQIFSQKLKTGGLIGNECNLSECWLDCASSWFTWLSCAPLHMLVDLFTHLLWHVYLHTENTHTKN